MSELNWKPGQSAEIRLLGSGPSTIEPQLAKILEFAGKRMRLAAAIPVESGSAVRLDWDGQLVLGQVLFTESGGFWMEVQHMLLDGGGLSWQQNGWRSE